MTETQTETEVSRDQHAKQKASITQYNKLADLQTAVGLEPTGLKGQLCLLSSLNLTLNALLNTHTHPCEHTMFGCEVLYVFFA